MDQANDLFLQVDELLGSHRDYIKQMAFLMVTGIHWGSLKVEIPLTFNEDELACL